LGTEESQESYEKRFEDYAGLGSSHRLLFLYGAEKFERVGLPPEDAQYLQTRQFDIAEIARIYDIPTFMLHDHDKTSSWAASVTAMEESFINLCMLPHCIQWEQELNTKLLDGGDGHYCKFTIDGLLRGNVKDRAEAYKTLASIGVYTVNDILELEERNPIAEDMGNARLVPLNMAPLDKLVSGEVKSVGTKTED
jgi:HK97 family phage portal protein